MHDVRVEDRNELRWIPAFKRRRQFAAPFLAVYTTLTTDDHNFADEVWKFDMMKELGISQHNMANCSMTTANGMLFVCTSNGTDETLPFHL